MSICMINITQMNILKNWNIKDFDRVYIFITFNECHWQIFKKGTLETQSVWKQHNSLFTELNSFTLIYHHKFVKQNLSLSRKICSFIKVAYFCDRRFESWKNNLYSIYEIDPLYGAQLIHLQIKISIELCILIHCKTQWIPQQYFYHIFRKAYFVKNTHSGHVYLIHFNTNTIGKGKDSFPLPPAMC